MSKSADTRVARRYAGALFAAAQQLNALDAVRTDLESLHALWQHVPTLSRTMESPLVPPQRKRALIDETLGRDLHVLTRTFLYLLIDKRRADALSGVRAIFAQLADEARGILRAVATVATPLAEADRQALAASLGERTGKSVVLEVEVDRAVLGGVTVRMQDTVLDGSLRGGFERLREQMLRETQAAPATR
jgi:F-type H+-transporting ATPase subunit delta